MKMTEVGFDILFNSVHPNVFSNFLPFEITVHLTVAHQVLRRPTGYTEVLLHRTARSAFIHLPQPHPQGPKDCFGL